MLVSEVSGGVIPPSGGNSSAGMPAAGLPSNPILGSSGGIPKAGLPSEPILGSSTLGGLLASTEDDDSLEEVPDEEGAELLMELLDMVGGDDDSLWAALLSSELLFNLSGLHAANANTDSAISSTANILFIPVLLR